MIKTQLFHSITRLALAFIFTILAVSPAAAQSPEGTPTPTAESGFDHYAPWPPRPMPILPESSGKENLPDAGCADANQLSSPALQWTGLVFESFRNLNWDIYYSGPAWCSSTDLNLTSHPGFDGYPRISRATNQIVFVSDRGGSDDIYSMSLDGKNLIRLTSEPSTDTYPTWSPDGKQVAFISDRTGDPELFVMSADGSGVRQLTNFPGKDLQPDWSPDGSRILFTHVWDTATGSLYTVNPSGTDLIAFSGALPLLSHPIWSPDGKMLAVEYDSNRDGYVEIGWGSFSSGSPDHSISCPYPHDTTRMEECALGSWSPDGEYLFTSLVHYISNNGMILISRTYLEAIDTLNPFSIYSTEICSDSLYEFYLSATLSDRTPPVSHIDPFPEYTRLDQFIVNISITDSGGSGLSKFWLDYSNDPKGPWTNQYQRDISTGSNFSWSFFWNRLIFLPFPITPGAPIYLRIRAVDQAGNMEADHFPPDTYTKVYTNQATGRVTDQRDVPLADVSLHSTAILDPTKTDADGYASPRLFLSGPGAVEFSKPYYYSPLAQPWISKESTAPFRAVLHSEPNLLMNGDLEAFSQGSFSNWQSGGNLPISASSGFSGQFASKIGANCETPNCMDLAPLEEPLNEAEWNDSDYRFAVDPEGLVHVVTAVNGLLYSVHRDTAGTWSRPEPIGGLNKVLSSLVIDSQSTLYAIGATATNWMLAQKPKGGSWVLEELPFMGARVETMKIDERGRLHVLFHDDVGNSRLFYSFRDSATGVWSSPFVIVGGLDSVSYPSTIVYDMAVGYGNRLDVAWYDPYHTSFNNVTFYTSGVIKANQKFEVTDPDITQGLSSTSILGLHRGPDGTLRMIYGYFNGLYSADLDANGNWAVQRFLYPDDTYNGFGIRRATVDSNGNFHIVGIRSYYSANTFMYLYIPAGQKGVEYSILNTVFVNYNIQVAADKNGGAHFLVSNYNTDHYQLHYMRVARSIQDGNGWLSQTVTIPAETYQPTLSFMYWLGQPLSNGLSSLEALVTPEYGQPVSLGTWTERGEWRHGWVDLSAWAGQTVTITLRLNQAAGEPFIMAHVDEAFVGAWTTLSITEMSPIPDHWLADLGTREYTFTLKGTNFSPNATLTLGSRVVPFTYSSNNELTFSLPADLPPGYYTPRLANPGGIAVSAPGAIGIGIPMFLPLVGR